MSDPSDLDQLVLNLDVAGQVGITVPEAVIERASLLVRDGEIIRQ
jgi:ABC-type uncharacterized transport system substrate-binding protein